MTLNKGQALVLVLASLATQPSVEAAEGAIESSLTQSTGTSQEQARGTAQTEFHFRQFSSLKDAILLYEAIQYSGDWRSFAPGPSLKAGERHAQVALLRGQLALLGDLPPQTLYQKGSQYFDKPLETALKRFQKRHSIKADGVLGPQTRSELNVPPWQRVDQLVLNSYRQEQLHPSAESYLHVNLPEYRLRLYHQGEVKLDMRTVVGKPDRQTPVFSSVVNRVVVNPDWNVPKSIAYRDILPKLQRDPGFLEKRNLRVLSGWSEPQVEVARENVDFAQMYLGKTYYRFWEPPGRSNTLGRVKFQLSSDNSIYLHDTRDKHLFGAEKRAFSSGCIRLENPRGLADALVQLSNRWSPDMLDPLFEQDETIKLKLLEPVPVYVTYWTAWLDEGGTLKFASDFYERDAADFEVYRALHQQVGMLEN